MAIEKIQEEEQGNVVAAKEWSPKDKKLAKGLLNTVSDGISNTDLQKSDNNADDDESTDESCSSGEGRDNLPAQVGPGLFPSTLPQEAAVEDLESESEEDDDVPGEHAPGFVPINAGHQQVSEQVADENEQCSEEQAAPAETIFNREETVLIFDWDDTVLPSSWVQGQGLRLDDSSEVSAWQREQLSQVANAAAETLRMAKQMGTVVLITNAERGWIELSCQKFMPTLYPALESVKVISARTTYESPEIVSPLDWKVHAFANEIRRYYGQDALVDGDRRKNVLSLGDSVHEREALLRASAPLPNCRSKSLKFVERPDIAQICKQHSLVTSCFERIVHHDGNLDLCIRCT
eukprot:gb/GFBE01035405.1/.p1 GENE.gb/GFBE01035405.1/~~gb/GFBE01035405.1/.p1  ORF type:complete len:349 (+),score=106.81 gb/GFBE01035405.1/:1-1047(+)